MPSDPVQFSRFYLSILRGSLQKWLSFIALQTKKNLKDWPSRYRDVSRRAANIQRDDEFLSELKSLKTLINGCIMGALEPHPGVCVAEFGVAHRATAASA
jgi:hypothetical protein